MDFLEAEQKLGWQAYRVIFQPDEADWERSRRRAYAHLRREKTSRQILACLSRLSSESFAEADVVHLLMALDPNDLVEFPILKDVRDFAAHPAGLNQMRGPIRQCAEVNAVILRRNALNKDQDMVADIEFQEKELRILERHWLRWDGGNSSIKSMLVRRGEGFVPINEDCCRKVWKFLWEGDAGSPISFGLSLSCLEHEILELATAYLGDGVGLGSEELPAKLFDSFCICILSIMSGCLFSSSYANNISFGLCYRDIGICATAIIDVGDFIVYKPILPTRVANDRVDPPADDRRIGTGRSYWVSCDGRGAARLILAT